MDIETWEVKSSVVYDVVEWSNSQTIERLVFLAVFLIPI
jgi:hypothetical protein